MNIKQLALKEHIIADWWQDQHPAHKWSFVTAFVMGFVVHLYVFTNRFMNLDDLRIVYAGHNIPSGRWFNNVINNLNFTYTPPLMIGLFFCAFIATMTFVVCKGLAVKHKLSGVLLAGLIVTFPPVAVTAGYLYELGGYFFAAMLSAFAFYVSKQYKFGWVVGGVLLMLTMAIYQSKVSIALLLAVVYLIFNVLDSEFSYPAFVKYALRFGCMAVLGGVLYFASLSVVTWVTGVGLHDYRGIDTMHTFYLADLPLLIAQTYLSFYAFFFGALHSPLPQGVVEYHLTATYLLWAYAVIVGVSGVLVVILAKRGAVFQSKGRGLLLLGLLASVPFVANFSSFFDTAPAQSMLMSYPFVLVFLIPILALERLGTVLPEPFCNTVPLGSGLSSHVLIKKVSVAALLVIVFNYTVVTNVYYLQLDIFFQRTFSLTTRVLSKIEPYMLATNRITFVGDFLENNPHFPHGSAGFNRPINPNLSPGLDNQFIGFETGHDPTISFVAQAEARHGIRLQAQSSTPTIYGQILERRLPVFPATGSVQLIDDTIVVVMGHTGAAMLNLRENGLHRLTVNHTTRGLDEVLAYDIDIYRDEVLIRSYHGHPYDQVFETYLEGSGAYSARVRVRSSDGVLLTDVRTATVMVG